MLSKWRQPEIIFVVWCLLALAVLFPITILLDGSMPFFTVAWVLVPFGAVVKTRDASQVGFRKISWQEFTQVAAINLGGLFLITMLLEPWSHTYRMLVEAALSNQPPDTTFAWLLRFERIPALGAMFLYSGLVTMFGEELFFRGWLLQVLKKRRGAKMAILIQAFFFTLPNLLATIALPPWQGVIYFVYSFVAIGIVGGWAASRTDSIWPSLFSATVSNLVFVALML